MRKTHEIVDLDTAGLDCRFVRLREQSTSTMGSWECPNLMKLEEEEEEKTVQNAGRNARPSFNAPNQRVDVNPDVNVVELYQCQEYLDMGVSGFTPELCRLHPQSAIVSSTSCRKFRCYTVFNVLDGATFACATSGQAGLAGFRSRLGLPRFEHGFRGGPRS